MVSRLPSTLSSRRLLTSLCYGDLSTIHLGPTSWQRIPRLASSDALGMPFKSSAKQLLLRQRAALLSARCLSPAAAATKQSNVETESSGVNFEEEGYAIVCARDGFGYQDGHLLPKHKRPIGELIFTCVDDASYYSRCVVVGNGPQRFSQISKFAETEQELLTFLQFSARSEEVLNAAGDGGKGKKSVEGDGGKPKLPNSDRLNAVKDFLVQQIPNVLSKQHEYRVYTKDVVFENNWDISKPVVVVGQVAYAMALFKARFYIHSKYAKVKVTVLAASVDEGAGDVVVRWRLAGLPQLKAFMFWKFVPFRIKSKAREDSEWIEGLSTFYVNADGFIYKHRLDRMIPDKGSEVNVKLKDLRLGLQGT